MKNFLVVCKETGQSMAFKRVVLEHSEKNNIPVQWFFVNDSELIQVLEEKDIQFVLISPEMMLQEKKIKEELERRKVEYLSMKPIDFGLRRMDKLIPVLEPYINK